MAANPGQYVGHRAPVRRRLTEAEEIMYCYKVRRLLLWLCERYVVRCAVKRERLSPLLGLCASYHQHDPRTSVNPRLRRGQSHTWSRVKHAFISDRVPDLSLGSLLHPVIRCLWVTCRAAAINRWGRVDVDVGEVNKASGRDPSEPTRQVWEHFAFQPSTVGKPTRQRGRRCSQDLSPADCACPRQEDPSPKLLPRTRLGLLVLREDFGRRRASTRSAHIPVRRRGDAGTPFCPMTGTGGETRLLHDC